MRKPLEVGFYTSVGIVALLIAGVHYGYIGTQFDVFRFSLLAVIGVVIGSDLPEIDPKSAPHQQDGPGPGARRSFAGLPPRIQILATTRLRTRRPCPVGLQDSDATSSRDCTYNTGRAAVRGAWLPRYTGG